MQATAKSQLSIGEELRSLRQNKLYLTIMILLMVGAVIWVALTIMDAGDESDVTAKAIKYATPINPNLDVSVFETIEAKRLLTEEELNLFPINRVVKDRSGNYLVVPYDTPKDEIELITTGTRSTPAPTPQSAPKIASPSANSSASARSQ